MIPATLSPEWKLLRAAVRADTVLPGPLDLGDEWAAVNWDRLLWLGCQHQVLPSLHEATRTEALKEKCPVAIRQQLVAFREVNQLLSLSRARELCQLQDIFQREAVPALCTDDWLASRQSFRRAGWGPFRSRLEFLVPAGDRERAAAAVAASGRSTKDDSGKLYRVDLSPVRLVSSIRGTAMADRVWTEGKSCEVGGRDLLHPAPADWLLWAGAVDADALILSHAALLVTLAARLDGTGWARLAEEAGRMQLASTIAATLAAAHRAFDLPEPRESAGRLRAAATPLRSTDSSPIVNGPFLPSPTEVIRRMLKLAGVGPGDVVYDLGCGDGRMVVTAAEEFGARGVGIELDPARIAEARALAAARGVADRVEFQEGDVFETDFSGASVVLLYLLPGMVEHLAPKFLRVGRPGLRIVSHAYHLGAWPPERTEIIRTGPLGVAMIYLWRVPAPLHFHRAFGLNIRSCLPLPEALPAEGPSVEVDISYGEIPAELPGLQAREAGLQAGPNALRLKVEGVATFWVRDGRSIVIARDPAAQDDDVRAFLLGSAFGALLHQRRDLVLHGSAVEWGGGCIVFVGESGIGKSTLATAFRKKGHAVLTDDLCVIRPGADGRMLACPSFPQTKLWLDSLQQLNLSPEGLRPIRYKMDKRAVPLGGGFATAPLPVRKIFQLGTQAGGHLTLTPAQGPAKFSILTAHTYRFSFLAGMAGATGHFQQAMALAQQVPVAVVIRPEGEFRLDELVALIEADLRNENV